MCWHYTTVIARSSDKMTYSGAPSCAHTDPMCRIDRYRIDIIFRSHAEDWGVLWALAFHSVWVTALTLVAAALVRCYCCLGCT